MLNIFPIQFLAPFAYMLLRICVGFIFLHFSRVHILRRSEFKNIFTLPLFPYGGFFAWYVALVECIIGFMFIAGFLTQVAALLAILYSFKMLFLYRWFKHPLIPSKIFFVLLFFASLSLFITGAGLFAFDLPI